MNLVDFKEKIHSRIDCIDDNNFLSTVYDILENGLPLPKNIIDNPDFQKAIEKGLDDIEKGKVVTLEQSNKEIDEWLNQ